MNGSESSKPSESGSRARPQPVGSTDSPSSSPTASTSTTVNVNYSTLDPFTLMNTPNNAFFPGQSPNTPHMVNPSAIVDNNPFASFPATQPPPPQYQQQQLMMWPFIPQQPYASNIPLANGPFPFANPPPPVHSYPPTTAGPSRPTLQHISPVPETPQTHSPSSSTQESPVDPEEAAVAEDKRRRNTAASARFRIKKKQKNLNLERTVSDLTSRAEELEREATNLRRENSWLKEIVMMKGRRNLAGGDRLSKGVSSDAEGDIEDGHKKSSKAKKRKANSDDVGNGKYKDRRDKDRSA